MSKHTLGIDDVLKLILVPEGDISDDGMSSSEDDEMTLNQDEQAADYIPQPQTNLTIESQVHQAVNIELPTADNIQGGRCYQWKKIPFKIPSTEFKRQFTDAPIDIPTPMEYFKMFIDSDIIAHITEQTNLYAIQETLKAINVTSNEMEQFIGALIYIGIFKFPSYRMIWSNESRFSLIADIMSRNRFETILRYLHFNDNSKLPTRDSPYYDKLFKIRPLIDKLRANLHKLEPEEYHSIDEQVVPYKGRSSLKQYNKNKPHKWGFKVFTRAGVSGLMYDFMIYTGKGMKLNGNFGVSSNVVVTLLQNLEKGQNFKIFFDNWFTSIDLVVHLKSEQFWSIGTIRADRMKGCILEADKCLKASGRGSFDYRTDETKGVTITKWFDSKAVHVVSSYCGAEPLGTVQRFSRQEGHHVNITRPKVIEVYNKHMGGVDLADMLIELYRIDLRSRKWYNRLVWYCIDVAVNQGWLLYRRHMEQMGDLNYVPLLDFRSSIACSLMKSGKTLSKKRGRPSSEQLPNVLIPPIEKRRSTLPIPSTDIRYDDIAHWPLHSSKMRCRLCKVGFSRFKCSKCLISLCLNAANNCFVAFHKK